jgi:hypothetical protein
MTHEPDIVDHLAAAAVVYTLTLAGVWILGFL